MLDNPITTTHSNGLNKDLNFQQTNDVTFALNAVRDNHEGGRQEYQSEAGNQFVFALPDNKFIVGSIYGENNEIYLFSTDGTISEIGLFKKDSYTELVQSDCLNFNLEYPITGEYRVRNGCEKVIYWCDHINPDRFFNITKQKEFKIGNDWDCNKFKINPSVTIPKIDLLRVNDSGGSLPSGSFYFQLEVLDGKENVIFSSDVTPQTPIYEKSRNLKYGEIDGSLNTPQYDPTIGGVPVTNKSITLTFSNLDTTFKYLRVNVFRKIAGTKVLDGHSVASLIPITSSTINWTYTGYNTGAGDFPIDVSEKLIDGIIYDSAYVMEQVQGRMLRANLKQTIRDYSTYQQFASQITGKWVAQEVKHDDVFELGNAKNPNTYWYKTSNQGDEIYLPGIRYLHNNGEWSPVFPLVGRKATSQELELITPVGNTFALLPNQVWESEVEHIPLSEFEIDQEERIGNKIKRWKLYNTATVTNTNTTAHPYSWEGEFAYYETDEVYPTITNCDNESIWGPDVETGDKVRLFKFPDRQLIPHANSEGYIIPFGYKFDNIVYPNSDIIAHQFCQAERTEFDKTVVDSGWATAPTWLGTTGNYDMTLTGALLNDPRPSNTEIDKFLRYNSANTLFNQNLFSFEYYKVNRGFTFQSQVIPNAPTDYAQKTLTTDGVVYSVILYMNLLNSNVPIRTNYLEYATVLVEPAETLKLFSPVNAEIQSLDKYVGDTISTINWDLDVMNLQLGNTQIFTKAEDSSTNTQLRVHNFYTYKKNYITPYKSFLNRNYKTLHYNPVTLSDSQIFFGGGTLISETTSFRQAQTFNVFYAPFYKHHFEEHDVNTALRIRGTELEFQYFRDGVDGDEYNFDKSTTDAVILPYVDRIPEYFRINNDYTLEKVEKGKFSLTEQYDYCNSCEGSYPNRIVWSPKSFDEETFDLYRLNKVNDYLDLPAHRGEITGLCYQNNQLLVHTKETTFILQPNPQQISTDQNTAYLTTGDFLSIPPQEMIQTDIGMAGCQSKQSQCNTPEGHCWVDQNRGEVFKWNGQVEMLSNKGLVQWFKEYLPSELQSSFYNINSKEYPIKSTLTQKGIGVILYYDPKYRRLLITKRDIKPIYLVGAPVTIGVGFTYYFGGQWYGVRDPDYGYVPVDTNDPMFFENKDWTISYSFNNQTFTSWHSYIPFHSFCDDTYFYTSNTPSIFKHLHYTNYQTFFNTKYDFVIEWMNYNGQTFSESNLYYIGQTHLWNSSTKQFTLQNKTFDKFVIYNDNQSTGLQSLILQNQQTNPYQSVTSSPSSKYVIKTDSNYKIGNIWDMSVGQPTMSKEWSKIQLYNGYIDQVVNTDVINFNKSQYDYGNITDKLTYTRLFFKPNEDYRKTIVLQTSNKHLSIR